MITKKPSAKAQKHLSTKKAKLKDLTPKARAAEQLKGGPSSSASGNVIRYIGETEK